MFSSHGSNSLRRCVLWIIAILWCGAAVAQSVTYDYDKSVDFTRYKTYKWVLVADAQYPDQITDNNIRAAIDKQLATKGLTKKEADPVDLFVGYQLSMQEEKQISAYGGGAGWRFGGGMASATTSTYDVGTLVLDIYDPATKTLVWRGSATKTVNPSKDPAKNQKKLESGAEKLLKNYPPAK